MTFSPACYSKHFNKENSDLKIYLFSYEYKWKKRALIYTFNSR